MKPFLLSLMLFVLASCGGGGIEPRHYGLDAAAIADQLDLGKSKRGVLRVAKPTAGSGLSGRSIQVIKASGELTVVENGLWADPLPDLLQKTMVASLAASNRYSAVVASAQEAPAKRALATHVERFAIRYDASGAAYAEARLRLTLLALPSKKPLKSVMVEESTPLPAISMAFVTDAFQAMLAQGLSDVLR